MDGRELRFRKDETMALTNPFILKVLLLLGLMHIVVANTSDEVCCIHLNLLCSRSCCFNGGKVVITL